MREYLELSDQALMDEGRVDAYVLASHRFIAGQEALEEDLAWSDLVQGREGLYRKKAISDQQSAVRVTIYDCF